MRPLFRLRLSPAALLTALCTALLGACGGSSNSAAIGGNASGLASGTSVVLQDNGSDTLTLTANGSFQFPKELGGNMPYSVTVLTQPAGQFCAVGNGSGSTNTNADTVKTVSVSCISLSSVGGTVSGLGVGTAVTLSDGTVLLPVALDGAFAFPGLLATGAAYDVTVAIQPAGESCTVLNGSGTVVEGTTASVTVSCSPL